MEVKKAKKDAAVLVVEEQLQVQSTEAPVEETVTEEDPQIAEYKSLAHDKQVRVSKKLRAEFIALVFDTYKKTEDEELLPSLMEEAIAVRNKYEALVKATQKHRDILKKMDRNLANLDRGAAYKKIQVPVVEEPVVEEAVVDEVVNA